MADYYLVRRLNGPSWDDSRPRREQDGWDEHAAFMDELTERAAIVLGGPVGKGEGDGSLLVLAVGSAEEARALIADDPWGEDMLETASVEPWRIWLRAPTAVLPSA